MVNNIANDAMIPTIPSLSAFPFIFIIIHFIKIKCVLSAIFETEVANLDGITVFCPFFFQGIINPDSR